MRSKTGTQEAQKGANVWSFLGLLCMLCSCSLFLVASGCRKPDAPAGAEIAEIRIPRGAGGVGFLPLLVMEKYSLVERQAEEAGITGLRVRWIDLGGPAVMNDAL